MELLMGVKKKSAWLDLGEKVILLIIFSVLMARMLQSTYLSGAIFNGIYLFDQAIILAFILVRRNTDNITARYDEWFAGFAGTFMPLLAVPVDAAAQSPLTALALLAVLLGMALHLSAKLTLRRSFGVVAANRGVKVTGPYRMVRHPMYTGYILVHIGFLLAGPNLHNAVVFLSCWALLIWRISAEERILSSDFSYAEMMKTTRYRLLPGVY